MAGGVGRAALENVARLEPRSGVNGFPEPVGGDAGAPVPLTLYVHVPWCVRKCPYCDFNSHPADETLPERDYLSALLRDLDHDLPLAGERRVVAVFIGGGTPSLCSSGFYTGLLSGIRDRLALAADAEITLEANPGTVTERYLADLLEVGVNRLSVGVQSFDDQLLAAIGRIHDGGQARRAVQRAARLGFREINLDLMFGLPGQRLAQCGEDLHRALDLAPTHISYYQLTLEPGTPFGRAPPGGLPDDGTYWEMQEQGLEMMRDNGYGRYEISAYSRPGHQCRHNRNYWEFGDYLGIGAGAHGKLTRHSGYVRTRKVASPAAYQRLAGTARCGSRHEEHSRSNVRVEFLLNALRLVGGVPAALFPQRTGQSLEALGGLLEPAVEAGFVELAGGWLRPTPLGLRFLDGMLAECMVRAGD